MTIYFIGNGVGEVKIGFTRRDPMSRLADLQVGNPNKLALLAFCPGTTQDEKRLHERFAAVRTHGEWFRLTTEIGLTIESLRTSKKPKLEPTSHWKFSIEFGFAAPSAWKSKAFSTYVHDIGYKNIEEWGNDVLSRELERIAASGFVQDLNQVDRASCAREASRLEKERLATIDGPVSGHQLRISLTEAISSSDRFPVAVSLRRWRNKNSGWVPAPAMLLFPHEIFAVGKALRLAFERLRPANDPPLQQASGCK